jgi:hypothetical protein
MNLDNGEIFINFKIDLGMLVRFLNIHIDDPGEKKKTF